MTKIQVELGIGYSLLVVGTNELNQHSKFHDIDIMEGRRLGWMRRCVLEKKLLTT